MGAREGDWGEVDLSALVHGLFQYGRPRSDSV